jgi:lipoyl(octanoyl) transferase
MAGEIGAGRGVVAWLGRADYRATWALQRGLAEARRQALAPDTVLLVEHPPTITLGRRGTPRHVLLGAAELRRRGIAVVPIDRGGDVTYHGPGQLVVYPILHLGRWGSDIVRYVRRLEEVGIRAAAEFGVRAERQVGLTGVWVGDAKLAAIGVRVSRWVTTHGMALNVAPDLGAFAAIIPCGLRDRGVTSLQAELGRAPAMAEVQAAVARHFAAVFDLPLAWADAPTVRGWALPAPPEPTPSALQLGQSVA